MAFELWAYYNAATGRRAYVKEWPDGRQVKISKRRWKKFQKPLDA